MLYGIIGIFGYKAFALINQLFWICIELIPNHLLNLRNMRQSYNAFFFQFWIQSA